MTSLCGQFTTFAKLVICAMMIRGRHRGLPYAVDRAVMLPSESSRRDMAGPISPTVSKASNVSRKSEKGRPMQE